MLVAYATSMPSRDSQGVVGTWLDQSAFTTRLTGKCTRNKLYEMPAHQWTKRERGQLRSQPKCWAAASTRPVVKATNKRERKSTATARTINSAYAQKNRRRTAPASTQAVSRPNPYEPMK